MKQIIEQRIAQLSNEIQVIHSERESLAKRDSELEIRLHQLVGAIYEMQQLIADLDRQPSVPGAEIELVLNSDQKSHP